MPTNSFSSFQKPNPFAPVKKPSPQSYEDNPFELFKQMGDHLKQGGAQALENVTGIKYSKSGGDLKPGQEMQIGKPKPGEKGPEKKPEAPKNIEPGDQYHKTIVEAGKSIIVRDKNEIQKDIQNLLGELQKLSAASQELKNKVTEATGPTIVSPGKYHKSFLQHVLSVVKSAREKIENAGAWLGSLKKKQQKGLGSPQVNKAKSNNFWSKVKKHGTQELVNPEHSPSRSGG